MEWAQKALEYIDARSASDCNKCTIFSNDRLCIPDSCVSTKGEGEPLFIVTSYPKESDLIKGRILNGADRTHMLNWVTQFDRIPPMYITSAVKCMPKGDRSPKSKEIKNCSLLHLNQELQIINPKVVMLLGKDAIRAFFHCTVNEAKEMLLDHIPSYSRFTSKTEKWTGSVYTSYHPSYFRMGGQTAVEREYDCILQFNHAIKELSKYGPTSSNKLTHT